MIRQATKNDADEMIQIWLDSSRLAHDFIPFEYWQSHVQDMKNVYLPQSKSFVIETNSIIVGFLSLVSDCIAALFVSPKYQKQGYGKMLLQFAKLESINLSLCVYKDNINAVGFYLNHGFVISSERVVMETNKIEFVMNWSKANNEPAQPLKKE